MNYVVAIVLSVISMTLLVQTGISTTLAAAPINLIEINPFVAPGLRLSVN